MAELDQYLDLYLAEAQEHLGTLNRGILDLESGGGGDSLDAAFRAAHTIKGMSAMMAHDRVTAVAHRLEDQLDAIRAGRAEIDPDLIDELLAGADELARTIDAATVSGAASQSPEDVDLPSEPGRSPASVPVTPIPDEAELVVRVVLAEDCHLRGARALIAHRAAAGVCDVVGTSPRAFDDDFDGDLWLFVGPGADSELVAGTVRAVGEIESVDVLPATEIASEAATPVRPARADDAPVASPDSGEEPGEESATAEQAAAQSALVRAGARHVKADRRQLVDLADGMGDLAILAGHLERVSADAASVALREVVESIGRRVRDLQNTVLALRMVPAGVVFDRLPRVIRDTARSLGKEVDFQLEGREIELDREILEELVDPLIHILRNAIDHGLEDRETRIRGGKPPRGRLVLRMSRERSSVLIEVEDDGRGVARDRVFATARSLGLLVPDGPEKLTNEDILRLLSQPGFSTAGRVSSVSGRGVGMDAVVTRIRSLGGGVSLRSRDGQGTTFVLRLPITLALIQALRVRVGDEDYAVPVTHVTEALNLDKARAVRKEKREVIRLRGKDLPLVRLRAVLDSPTEGPEAAAVVTELGDRRAALVVDQLIGREQIIVKGFDAAVGTLKVFSGAALLADGRPALVLDPISVI